MRIGNLVHETKTLQEKDYQNFKVWYQLVNKSCLRNLFGTVLQILSKKIFLDVLHTFTSAN